MFWQKCNNDELSTLKKNLYREELPTTDNSSDLPVSCSWWGWVHLNLMKACYRYSKALKFTFKSLSIPRLRNTVQLGWDSPEWKYKLFYAMPQVFSMTLKIQTQYLRRKIGILHIAVYILLKIQQLNQLFCISSPEKGRGKTHAVQCKRSLYALLTKAVKCVLKSPW